MAIDKAVDSAVLDAGLLAVANAIRTKGGSNGELNFPAGFVDAVNAIATGSGGSAEGIYTGTYVSAERVKENISFDAPGAASFAIFLTEEPDLTTGVAFCTAVCGCKNGCFTSAGSNNSGSTVSGARCDPVGIDPTSIAYYPGLSFTDDGVSVIFNPHSAVNSTKLPQVGKIYNWIAW